MEKLDFELFTSRFFIFLFTFCIALMSGCDKNNSGGSTPAKPDQAPGIEQPKTETSLSAGAQQSNSTLYSSSSTVGEVAESKMKSQKYQLSATFVVPNKTSNKQGQ